MTGRVALVAGGIGELGRAICERLARQGCRIAVMDVAADGEAARQWREQAQERGYEVSLFEADATSFESCAVAVKDVEKSVGPVDILVHCVGITRDCTLRKMEPDQWDAVLTTNLDSVFNVTRQVVDGMVERGYGRIINISSLNGEKGQFGQTNYAASKAGMHGFTMALAQEVGPKGITVNTVSPGYMATRMVKEVPEEILAGIVAGIPVGRLGRPEEIAAVVAFLASDDAAYITGANLSVNGGQHMH